MKPRIGCNPIAFGATPVCHHLWTRFRRPREVGLSLCHDLLPVHRLAIIARLKSRCEERAAELIATGAPFDREESGFDRHIVFLSATEVVFVFEGTEVEWHLDDLVENPFRWMVSDAVEKWRPLIEGHPRIARETYFWEREPAE